MSSIKTERGAGQKSGVQLAELKARDLPVATRLMDRAVAAQAEQSGSKRVTTRHRHPPAIMEHLFNQDPSLSWGAYDGEKLLGFLISYLRERQWYVGYLYVEPAAQQLGVGGELLRAGLAEAQARNLYFQSLCAPGDNIRALGLCSRLGMFPRKNLFLLRRGGTEGWRLPTPSTTITMAEITSVETVTELNRMDCEVRGINRSADHCYWLADPDYSGYLFSVGERVVGYAYISRKGAIGPVLAVRDVFLTELIVHCLHEVRKNKSKDVKLWVNGKNFGTMQLLLDNHFMIEDMTILMTNRVFCDIRRYLPHSMVVF